MRGSQTAMRAGAPAASCYVGERTQLMVLNTDFCVQYVCEHPCSMPGRELFKLACWNVMHHLIATLIATLVWASWRAPQPCKKGSEQEKVERVQGGLWIIAVQDIETFAVDHCRSFRRTRHHCRLCGGIFCAPCSASRMLLPPKFQEETPQRICTNCAALLRPLQPFLAGACLIRALMQIPRLSPSSRCSGSISSSAYVSALLSMEKDQVWSAKRGNVNSSSKMTARSQQTTMAMLSLLPLQPMRSSAGAIALS